jgi:hypothetical protein
MASAGLTNTGYSESAQVSMYNTYQNRVATARESYNQAILNYNNAIKDAQLQNNAALAEIAYNTLQQQLQLSLECLQYNNQLVLEKANKKVELDNIYYGRYQDVLEQINRENALKEEIRQYQETMAWNTEQAEINRQHQLQMEAAQRQFQAQQAALDRQFETAMFEAETKAEKERLERQHEMQLALLEKEQKNKLAQMDKQLAAEKELLKYENDLDNIVIDTRGSSSGGSSGSKKTTSSSGSLGSVSGSKKTTSSSSKSVPTATVNGGGGAGTKKNSNTISATYDAGGSNSSKPTLNKASVLALGYGAISEQKLASLVSSGQVTTYTKNGQLYFQNNPKYNKLTSLQRTLGK